MALDKKQKILIPVTLVLFVFVIWMVYDTFFETAAPAITPVKQLTQTSSNTLQVPVPQAVQPQEPGTLPSLNHSLTATASAAESVSSNATTAAVPFSSSNPAEQDEYLQLVQQYQIAKLRRQLLEEKAAIAGSEARIAELDARTRSLGGSTNSASVTTQKSGLQLLYVDYQQGSWSAAISLNGRIQEVSKGDQLIDGTKILGINKEGVLIQQGQVRLYLTFSGIDPVPQSEKQSETDSLDELKLPAPAAPVSNSGTTGQLAAQVSEATKQEVTKQLTVGSAPAAQVVAAPSAPIPVAASAAQAVTRLPAQLKAQSDQPAVVPSASVAAVKPATPPSKPAQITQVAVQPAAAAKSPAKIQRDEPLLAMPQLPEPPAIKSSSAAPVISSDPLVKASLTKPVITDENKEQVAVVPAAPVSPQPKAALIDKATVASKASGFVAAPKVDQTKPPAVSDTATSKVKSVGSADEKRLLALPPKNYTLQLQAGNDRASLDRLIKENALGDKASIYRTEYLGQDWFVVVMGNYSSFNDAQSAINGLPASLRELNPWVRSIASIQQAITQR